jgi:sugar-specific transcriptional regulator TrmB
LQKIREALAQVERQLAAKEAYLAAKSEVNTDQRNRILEECKSIMREALEEAIVTGKSSMVDSKEPSPPQPTEKNS